MSAEAKGSAAAESRVKSALEQHEPGEPAESSSESKEHQPYIPASRSITELTLRAVILGATLGTVCADVLVVGETGGTNAKTVLGGFGVGFLYKVLGDTLKIFNMNPEHAFKAWKGASIGGELSPEMMGVGFIIGPKTANQMMAGG